MTTQHNNIPGESMPTENGGLDVKDKTIELLGHRVRLVDLSRPLEPTLSEPTSPRVDRISHQECAQMWELMYGIPPDVLPLDLGFAGEIIEVSTHASTHLDAPWHYAPTAEGEPAWTIDQVPLQWFVGKTIVWPARTFYMPSVHETAYPRLKSGVTPKQLATIYTLTPEELSLAERATKGKITKLGFLILLKTFQRLGYAVPLTSVPAGIVGYIAATAQLAIAARNS